MLPPILKMMSPNDFQQTKVVSNPLRSVTCRYQFTSTQTSAECKINKALIDLSQGVWTVTVDKVILQNVGPYPLKTIFDITTNLASTYKVAPNGSVYSTNQCLTSFQANLTQKNESQLFTPFPQNFFTVRSFQHEEFCLLLFPNELSANDNFKVEAEIRLLFQRMM